MEVEDPNNDELILSTDNNVNELEYVTEENACQYAYISISNEPRSYEEAKNSVDWPKWKVAVQEELDAIQQNNVWEMVEMPENCEILSTKWVFREKDDGTLKARLVVRGFEESRNFDFDELFAPVARLTTIRLLLNLSLQRNCQIRQLDVRNAFLNGKLESPVYVSIPEGMVGSTKLNNPVLRLQRALYGLKKAPKAWNDTFNECLLSLGFTRCKLDECLYFKNEIYLLIYVDDLIIFGENTNCVEEIITELKNRFRCRDLGLIKSFLGLQINCDLNRGTIIINQTKLIDKIAMKFGVKNCNPVFTPVEEKLSIKTTELKVDLKLQKKYRQLLGSLMYLMIGSRPDICYAIGFFGQFQVSPSEMLYKYLLRVLKYIWTTRSLTLVYRKSDNLELEVFADADWANCPNTRRSISGYCCYVSKNLITWKSKKQSLVTLSSSDAEVVAMCNAVCDGLSIMNLLSEINLNLNSFIVYEDNENCIRFSIGCSRKSKHLQVKFYFIRDLIQNNLVIVRKVSSSNQIADCLTKGLGRIKFEKFRIALGLQIYV